MMFLTVLFVRVHTEQKWKNTMVISYTQNRSMEGSINQVDDPV
jgi:hypothetical protein